MLAAHLRRLEKPVRYALDPAHEQAIRNYLAIASRAMQVPTFLQNRQFVHAMGNDLPLGQELGATLLGEHDPASLSGLLDLMHERGLTPYSQQNTTGNLLMPLLQQLHQNITGYGGRDENNKLLGAGAHPAVLRGYTNENVGRRGDSEYGQTPINTPQGIRDLVRGLMIRSGGDPVRPPIDDYWLNRLASTHVDPETRNTLRGVHDRIYQGFPHALVGLHDAMHSLPVGQSQVGQELAHGARTGLQKLHPALWHFGEHGTLPQ